MFTAVVPPDDVVADLDDFLAPRRDPHGPEQLPLRWTAPDSWHVTLGFMEQAPERSLDDLLERLARAGRRRRPFDMRIVGGGAFPGAASAKVLYAATSGTPADEEELRRLATGARAAATKAGAPVDGSRFRPHVTLARLRRPTDVVRWLRVLDTYESRPWTVSDYVLVRSHLGEGPRGRPRHEVVDVLALGR
jgi:RNA 2',3'-cyclic 3'-phosphodiesterase